MPSQVGIAMPEVEEKPRKRMGRPPKAPEKGRRQNYTFRMSDQTRDAVIEAAAQSGRSMSEEIEWRIEESFRENEDRNFVKSILGGSSDALNLLMSISAAAKTIEKMRDKSGLVENSRDWASHEPTRAAIRAAATRIIDHATSPVREYTEDLQKKVDALQEKNKLDKNSITKEEMNFMHTVSDILRVERMAMAGRHIAEVLIGDIDVDFLAREMRSSGILTEMDEGPAPGA